MPLNRLDKNRFYTYTFNCFTLVSYCLTYFLSIFCSWPARERLTDLAQIEQPPQSGPSEDREHHGGLRKRSGRRPIIAPGCER